MLIILIVTLLIAGLRLIGDSSVIYQALAHVWVGGLIGYSIATYNWFTIVSTVFLILVELYSVISKFVPSLLISNLIKIIFPKL